jgi:hypothetical protein
MKKQLQARGRAWWLVLAGALVGALVALQAVDVVPAAATSANVEVEVQAAGSFAGEGWVASDGTNRLVVWTVRTADGRAIKAALVRADGTVGSTLAVSDTAANGSPRVAWNGSTYLVVWEHTYPSGDIDVFGRKVSKSGVLAPSQFGVAVLSTHEREPAVVAGGATFYVAWTDDRNGNDDIYGTRISTAGNGAAVDGTGVQITTSTKGETQPTLAWNGTRYLVTYQLAYSATDDDVLARTVNASNVPSTTTVPIATSGSLERDPVVASNGSGFLVVWAFGPDDGRDIQGQRLSGTGSLAGGAISVSAAVGDQRTPTVAFNGTYLVAWNDERDSSTTRVYGGRIDGNGNKQDDDGVLLTGTAAAAFNPVVTAGAGHNWAMAFSRGSSASITIDLRTVAPK